MDPLSRMSQRVMERLELPDLLFGLSKFTGAGDPHGQIAYGATRTTFDLRLASFDGGAVWTQDPTLAKALRDTKLFTEAKAAFMPGLAPPGTELGYVEQDSNFSPGTLANTLWPISLTLAVDLSMIYRVKIGFAITNSVGGAGSYVQLLEDGVLLAQGFYISTGAAITSPPVELGYRRAANSPVPLTAGLHVYTALVGAFSGIPSIGAPMTMEATLR